MLWVCCKDGHSYYNNERSHIVGIDLNLTSILDTNIIENIINDNVEYISIGIPGPTYYKKGVVGDLLNLPLKGVNLKEIISKKFNKKVLVTFLIMLFYLSYGKSSIVNPNLIDRSQKIQRVAPVMSVFPTTDCHGIYTRK